MSLHDRTLKVAAVVESLEREMELLCLTGVEDQLQADVRPTLEMLRNAGIKVGPGSDPPNQVPRPLGVVPWNSNKTERGSVCKQRSLHDPQRRNQHIWKPLCPQLDVHP